MKIKPLNDMVYVEVSEDKEKISDGGIIMVTEDEIETYKLGKVLAAVESDNVKVKEGDTVILPPKIHAMQIEGRKFLIAWNQIYGVVEK